MTSFCHTTVNINECQPTNSCSNNTNFLRWVLDLSYCTNHQTSTSMVCTDQTISFSAYLSKDTGELFKITLDPQSSSLVYTSDQPPLQRGQFYYGRTHLPGESVRPPSASTAESSRAHLKLEFIRPQHRICDPDSQHFYPARLPD